MTGGNLQSETCTEPRRSSDNPKSEIRNPKSVDSHLWLALLLAIPALLPLAAPGYFFNAHDAHHSVFFLVELDQAIRDGVIWPVWGSDLALGFGYPLWLVYAPLAYYVAAGFHLLGLGFTVAVKATWALSFLVGAAGIYKLARRSAGASAYAHVQADTEVRLRFYTYYFPGWRATVDGHPAEISHDSPNGLIGLTLPPGEHEVRLRFGATPLRQVAAGVSLTALAGVLALFAWDRRR